MEKNRTPPTSPTTELPALMGGPEGRAQETPGTKRSLGNTNHGVAATGQQVRLNWPWGSQSTFCLWSIQQPQAPGQGPHLGPLRK